MQLMFSFILVMCRCMFILFSVADPGEGQGVPAPPYFSTKMRPIGPKKFFLETGPPSYLRVWMTRPPQPLPPLSEGLDSPLIFHNKVFLLVNFRDVANAFYFKIDESSYSTKT